MFRPTCFRPPVFVQTSPRLNYPNLIGLDENRLYENWGHKKKSYARTGKEELYVVVKTSSAPMLSRYSNRTWWFACWTTVRSSSFLSRLPSLAWNTLKCVYKRVFVRFLFENSILIYQKISIYYLTEKYTRIIVYWSDINQVEIWWMCKLDSSRNPVERYSF